MTKQFEIPCYILHRRPYRETSAIIDVVAEGLGRLSLIVRGVYNNKKKSGIGAQAQVFRPLLISYSEGNSGGGELKYAQSIDDNGPPVELQQKYLYSGFYINELITRLWPQNIESDELFNLYQQTLDSLVECQQIAEVVALAEELGQPIQAAQPNELEVVLRRFEFDLLVALGYGIDCFYTFDHDEAIEPDEEYIFMPQQGFSWLDPYYQYPFKPQPFNGGEIVAIGEMNFTQASTRKAAKRLIRLALAPHLGDKPLKSRELFIAVEAKSEQDGPKQARPKQARPQQKSSKKY